MVDLKNLLLSVTGAGAVALSASSLVLSTEGTLKEIEIYFYDKDNQNNKQIKIDLDVIETGGHQFKIKENNDWKASEKFSNQQEIPMYRKLFEIAQKYIKTQHYLNLIKASQPEENSLTPKCTDANQCCCTDGQCQADCKQSNCCSMCLCCYSDDTNNQTCCQQGTQCKWDKFKKTQKTFRHLSKNLLSYYYDSYLNAVQSHIKLTDVSFEELKTSSTSSTTEKTKKEYKTFIGTLTYGFVNYNYKETKFHDGMLPKNGTEQYETLENSKKYYFTNIPQSFKFEYVKKVESDSSSGEATTEPENSISKVVGKLSDIKQAQSQYKTPQDTQQKCCCDSVEQDKDIIHCLLGRSFVFKTESLEDIQNKVKNGKDCCTPKA